MTSMGEAPRRVELRHKDPPDQYRNDDDDSSTRRMFKLDRFPSLMGDDSNSSTSDDEEEVQAAVAASGALVGENVLDSPRGYRRPPPTRQTPVWSSTTPPQLPAMDLPTLSSNPTAGTSTPPAVVNFNNEDAMSVGIMAQGLAWVQRQHDRRRRLYLQNQAEQQLRKLRQAQLEEKLTLPPPSSSRTTTTVGGSSLIDNPTFQSLAMSMKGVELFTTTSTATNATDENHNTTMLDTNDPDDDDAFPTTAVISQSGDGYSVTNLPLLDDEDDDDDLFIPPVRIENESGEKVPFILTKHLRQQIATHVLPRGIVYCRWKRLYSLARDGDSFEACLRYLVEQPHDKNTLMVIRTSRNQILGAFADMPWEMHAQVGAAYFGGPTTCLWKVDSNSNNKVIVYKWSGANRYIQLCDVSNKRLAFGGGGDDGSFGLSVEQDFQVGTTGPCATFENEPLCDTDCFQIVDLEIFGFLIGQF